MGRLQTDADRERVVDSLANANEAGTSAHKHGVALHFSERHH
jgi:hypothetical protein